jgi:aquaporin Z
MRFPDFVGYVVAQMLGGIVGAAALAGVWRNYAASVQDGMTAPGAGWPIWAVFAWEVAITALLIFMILFFVSSPRLMRWTPLMNWILIATMVWLEAPISGTSLNPARSFGPALMSGIWQNQWLYAVAPPLGGVLGLLLFNVVTPVWRQALTGKLFATSNYPSVFSCDHAGAPLKK